MRESRCVSRWLFQPDPSESDEDLWAAPVIAIFFQTKTPCDEMKYASVGDAAAVWLFLFLSFTCLMQSVGYESLSDGGLQLGFSYHHWGDAVACFCPFLDSCSEKYYENNCYLSACDKQLFHELDVTLLDLSCGPLACWSSECFFLLDFCTLSALGPIKY